MGTQRAAAIYGVLDANILIDYVQTDPLVLKLLSHHIGQLAVLDYVLAEVNQLDESDCSELGIKVIEVDTQDLIAAGSPRKGLSFQDSLCLVVCGRYSLACITNDGKLRRECSKEGIAVFWGLELMTILVRNGHLTKNQAQKIVLEMHQNNPYITAKVVQDFLDGIAS